MKAIQGTTNLKEQASLTCEYFTDRRLMFYPCEVLRNDLLKLRVIEKSYGLRLESPRDNTGHGDTFSAFASALQSAHEQSLRRPIIAGTGMSHTVSPMQHALAELDRERIACEDEREMFRQYDQSGLANCPNDMGKALWQAVRIR